MEMGTRISLPGEGPHNSQPCSFGAEFAWSWCEWKGFQAAWTNYHAWFRLHVMTITCHIVCQRRPLVATMPHRCGVMQVAASSPEGGQAQPQTKIGTTETALAAGIGAHSRNVSTPPRLHRMNHARSGG